VLLIVCARTEQVAADRIRTGRSSDLMDLVDPFCACVAAVIEGVG
jgi:hypothetical protein